MNPKVRQDLLDELGRLFAEQIRDLLKRRSQNRNEPEDNAARDEHRIEDGS